MYDVVVAYRIYPGISKSPAYFSEDKFKLSEMCLQSFRRSLGGLKVRVWALLDGCPPEYEALFRESLKDVSLEILHLQKEGNYATFGRQIEILTKQTDSEYVFFAEDDYFYFPGALKKMLTFMRENRDVDFVTPYDHPDAYFTSSRHEKHLIRPFGDRYWRTASSTCLTFLTSKKVLLRTQSMFGAYCTGTMDCPIWLALTQKLGLGNAKVHWSNSDRVKIWLRTWLSGFVRIVFGRQYKLWSPLPTLSTHMESTCLSPIVDWEAEFSNAHPDRTEGTL
jgi:hypothetical protein